MARIAKKKAERRYGPPHDTKLPNAQEPEEAADSDAASESSPQRIRGPPTVVYTIEEFCEHHRISVAFYHKLRAQGLAPAELRLGSRVLITKEAAEAWRIERTRATTTTTENAA